MKKILSLVLSLLLILVCLPSCQSNKTDNVIIPTEMLKIDVFEYPSASFGLVLQVVTPNKEESFEFIRFEGENIENILGATLSESVIKESIADITSNGMYLHPIPIKVTTNRTSEQIIINKVILSISGTEHEIHLYYPVEHKFKKSDEDDISLFNGPLGIFGISFEINQIFDFSGTARTDINLHEFCFSKFLYPVSPELYIDGTYAGKLDGKTSYEIKTGEKFTIKASLGFTEPETTTSYDFITTMATVKYSVVGSEEIKTDSYPLNAQGITNAEHAQEALDYIVSKYN